MDSSVIDVIGNTPLIKLKRASEETGCTILGKAEFMNPGQSVKDRAGLFIIRDAERKGLLKPGGVIVEGTAGNTGIGLTVVAKALGYRTVIVIPDTQSQEKKDMLRLAGAELVERRPRLQRQHHAREQTGEQDDRYRADADAVHLGDRVAPVERAREHEARCPAAEHEVVEHAGRRVTEFRFDGGGKTGHSTP